MSRHRRKRNGLLAPRSMHCTHCGRPVQFCACSGMAKHRAHGCRPARTVLHRDLISVPSDPPIWRGVLVAAVIAAGVVAGWGVVQPADVTVVPASCEVTR